MIEVRDLVKRYGENLAVDHMSFTIEAGKVYGFLGPNGAGKSTTMNIMTGYLGPTEGTVCINGHNIMDEPEAAKKSIGYLPEHPPLYMDMKVSEYIAFAAELKHVPKARRKEEIERVIARCGLDKVRGRLIGNLSKGYKQRVGLAQAIIGSPEVVILDEPTVGLDPNQIIEIRDLIRTLGREHTVILSSHILSEVQEICDEVLIIHQGRLIAQGTPAQLENKLGAPSLEITVRSDSENAVKAMLFAVDQVKDVSCTVRDGEITAAIKTVEGADIREQVFNACVQNAIPLLMMRPIEFSLEQIFLKIIRDSAQGAEKKRKIKKVIRVPVAGSAAPETESAAGPAADSGTEVQE